MSINSVSIRCWIAAWFLFQPLSSSALNYLDLSLQREGLDVNIRIDSVADDAATQPLAGQFVQLTVDAKRLADRQTLDNWALGSWLDTEISPLSGSVPVCGQRVAGFLSGNLMRQPLLDLTGYYVLTLDQEDSVSVLDPAVNFANRSSLYSVLKLDGRGFDWLKTRDDSRLYVAVPATRSVAFIDLQTLRVTQQIRLPGKPTRLALAPDGRTLWVGQTGETESDNQLSVIDTVSKQVVNSLPLPQGHHEIAFSPDGTKAFVSNRDDGSLTMLDANALKIIKTWRVTGKPLSLVVTAADHVLWVADAEAGRLLRYKLDASPLDSITLKPGIGPIRLSPDQSLLMVLNPSEQTLFVIDAASGRLLQTLTIGGRPYDVIFSEQYAYVRSLDSEQVALLGLAELKTKGQTAPKYIPVGAANMAASGDLPLASSMSPNLDANGAFFALPSERTVYHYMEGMNAPDSGLRTYGHVPMSALTVQRGFRQTGPGKYQATFKLPSAGRLVLALASDNPRFTECIGLAVKADLPQQAPASKLSWVGDALFSKKVGDSLTLRVKTNNHDAFQRVGVQFVPAAGGKGQYLPLQADEGHKGEFFTETLLQQAGSYYLHIVAEPEASANFATLIVAE